MSYTNVPLQIQLHLFDQEQGKKKTFLQINGMDNTQNSNIFNLNAEHTTYRAAERLTHNQIDQHRQI